jgi:hypothetical protein
MPKNGPLRLPPFHFDKDPDPAFQSDADPHPPDPASQNDADPDRKHCLQLCLAFSS